MINYLFQSVQLKIIETQQDEVCFSTYRDTDSTGQGTLKADSIPDMKEAISELDTFRMDPNRNIQINLKFFQDIFEIKITFTLKCSMACVRHYISIKLC